MRDLMLQIAGGLGVLVACIHGVLGETKVFARARIEPPALRRLIRLVWQAGTAAWIGFGVLLAVTPLIASDAARAWIVGVAVAVYGVGVVANAWATRGRHFGWMALALVCLLALLGW